jgi:tRNA A-37 threonylcarbamoyl transferase component Bud32
MNKSSQYEVLLSYDENNNPNMNKTPIKLLNYNIFESQKYNYYPNRNFGHKKISSTFLTDNDYNLKDTPVPTLNLFNDHNAFNKIPIFNYNNITNNFSSQRNLIDNNRINNSSYYLSNSFLNSKFNNSSLSLNDLSSFKNEEEPKTNFILSEFDILNQIGKGGEGIIYTVRWKKNNKKYALKKCRILESEDIKKRKEDNRIIKEFIETTGCDGAIKTFGNICKINNSGFYDFYEIMELAEKDWEQEIIRRKNNSLFYQEYELMEIFKNLIRTFSLLQNQNITHRDIKPQNILLVNGKFKICDFGNSRILRKSNIIIQKIRGSEMFMSPILFKSYRSGIQSVRHNTYKSDVFSLGMCFFLAASLSYVALSKIREVFKIELISKIVNHYLSKRYSKNLINLLLTMLQIDENKRPDFSQLEILFP